MKALRPVNMASHSHHTKIVMGSSEKYFQRGPDKIIIAKVIAKSHRRAWWR